MNLIQKLIYRRQAQKYGDPRITMMWIRGNNRFFLKDGYTLEQINEIQNPKDCKAMIDFSTKRWKEWIRLQRKKSRRKAWWNATHRGEFERILTDHDSLLMFQEIMSREEFERFRQTHSHGRTS